MDTAVVKQATILVTALLGACATQPQVPDVLRPPVDQQLAFEILATGVQVYECGIGSQAGAYEWKFKGPEATLSDTSGRAMGTHYGGPTWKAPDGSTVVAEVKGRAPAKDPSAIPLLLLSRKGGDGDGLFANVRSIQRLDTVGGQAPSANCTKAQDLARVARVPYTATYYLYQ